MSARPSTHWDGCFATHHACALALIEEQEAQLRYTAGKLRAAREESQRLHERWIKWIGSNDAERVALIEQWAKEGA